MYKQIILKKEKEKSIQRFHPWIFSGALDLYDDELKDGDLVEVLDSKKNFLCIGHFFNGNIAVKILTFIKEEINQNFWNQKIVYAYTMRTKINLTNNQQTNCYRLVHGEGDNCAGLIIDIYDTIVVIQCHTIGMFYHINEIANAIKSTMPTIKTIYNKSKENLPKEFASQMQNGFLLGNTEEIICKENNNLFYINIITGQKTGFFLDQRNNRQLLGNYCNGKSVLNTYCYSGGFSVYAINNNATKVTSVDVSKTAMDLVVKNIALIENKTTEIENITMDVFDFFKENQSEYDIVILDPPAFAKSINKRHNAVQAYKRLNIEGLKKVKSGGFLFTFSCSQVVDKELFYATVYSAAIESKRTIRVLHHLSQPACHPVNIYHAESSFLKGLVLYVE